MDNWIESFVLTFVPLFIVIDALGNLPFVISLSEGVVVGFLLRSGLLVPL